MTTSNNNITRIDILVITLDPIRTILAITTHLLTRGKIWLFKSWTRFVKYLTRASKPGTPETIFNSASHASRERSREARRFCTNGAIAAAAISAAVAAATCGKP